MNPANYLRDTTDLVKQIETRFFELAARLYRIREEKLWNGIYDDYQEFLDTLRVDPAVASMLYSIHKNYVIEGGKTPEALAGIGYSNLYHAIPLIETRGINGAVVAASTLTRNEIRDEVKDKKHGRHIHKVGTERWGACAACGKLIRIDEAK